MNAHVFMPYDKLKYQVLLRPQFISKLKLPICNKKKSVVKIEINGMKEKLIEHRITKNILNKQHTRSKPLDV